MALKASAVFFNRHPISSLSSRVFSPWSFVMELSSQNSSTAGNGILPTPAGGGGGTHVNTPASTPAPNSGSALLDPAEEQKQNLNQTINSIQKTLGLLHQLYLTVSSFNVSSQLPLLQRLNSLVAELHMMQKLAENCSIQVPMEVVNLIDDGKNPDEFTKDVINSCIAKNQITKGKTDAFKSLRKYLLEELEQAFPDEVESFRDIRASSAAESKRLAQMQNALANGDVKVKTEL